MIERMLSTYLKRLGFSPATKGYCAVYLAIILVLENPNLLNSVTKKIYPIVAEECFSTPSCIEKRIRYAIERAWLKADIDFVEEMFQYSIDIDKGKPTNRQFIATLAEYVRLEIIFNHHNN